MYWRERKVLNSLLGFSAIALCFFASVVTAQTVEEQRSKAVAEILSKDTELTKPEYDKFWQAFKHFTPDERLEFIREATGVQGRIFAFNRSTWECADAAWMERRVVDCEKAETLWKSLEQDLVKKFGVSPSRASGPYENSKRIIQAAANRASYTSVSGSEYDLSKRETILETVRSLQGRERRLERVMQPKF